MLLSTPLQSSHAPTDDSAHIFCCPPSIGFTHNRKRVGSETASNRTRARNCFDRVLDKPKPGAGPWSNSHFKLFILYQRRSPAGRVISEDLQGGGRHFITLGVVVRIEGAVPAVTTTVVRCAIVQQHVHWRTPVQSPNIYAVVLRPLRACQRSSGMIGSGRAAEEPTDWSPVQTFSVPVCLFFIHERLCDVQNARP